MENLINEILSLSNLDNHESAQSMQNALEEIHDKLSNTECVIIPLKRYNDLVDSDIFLNALEAAGVDNWDGYDEAKEMIDNEDDN